MQIQNYKIYVYYIKEKRLRHDMIDCSFSYGELAQEILCFVSGCNFIDKKKEQGKLNNNPIYTVE